MALCCFISKTADFFHPFKISLYKSHIDMLILLGLHSKCISSIVSDKTITHFVTAGDSERDILNG